MLSPWSSFFFNDTATTEIYTLSLHDALPISAGSGARRTARTSKGSAGSACAGRRRTCLAAASAAADRSEEHTSELQSRSELVCRLLLVKKKLRISTLSTLVSTDHTRVIHELL